MIVVGIDTGKSGALAVVKRRKDNTMEILFTKKCPLIKKEKGHKSFNVKKMRKILKNIILELKPNLIVLEDVASYPKSEL